MKSPLVSVVIPTWNRAGEVRRAVDSVLAQTYEPIELIVVDDGSTDDTLGALSSYGAGIRVLSQENRGPSAARNTGLRASGGDLLAWLDSDDQWRPGKIAAQVALIEAAGPEVVCCLANSVEHWSGGRIVDSFENNRFLPARPSGILENPDEILLTRFLLFNPNVLARREPLFAAGLFDESMGVLEDYRLAVTLALAGLWCYTSEQLADIRRDSPHSLTAGANRDKRVAARALVGVYEDLLGGERALSARARVLARRSLAQARKRLARLEGDGAGGFADRAFMALWRRSPWFPKPRTRPLAGAAAREEAASWKR